MKNVLERKTKMNKMNADAIIERLKAIVNEYQFDEKPNSLKRPIEYSYLSGLETVCDDIKEIIKEYESEESK